MLPVELYRGEDALRIDRERVLRRSWQFVGHESQLPNPGDYIADVIGGAPVVVVRKADGALAGFHNVCRHRAGASGGRRDRQLRRAHLPLPWLAYAWTGGCATQSTSARPADPRELAIPHPLENWRGLLFVN